MQQPTGQHNTVQDSAERFAKLLGLYGKIE